MKPQTELIEIDFANLDAFTIDFIENELDKCRRSNIGIHIPKSKSVLHNGMNCAGFFDDSNMTFAVAYTKNQNHWLSTFVHESCHVDQWIDQIDIWNAKIGDIDPLEVIDSWLLKEVELDPVTKQLVFDIVTAIELDCEQRSVEKIKKFNLPLNITNYIKKSNAYVWSYRMVQETRNYDHNSMHEVYSVWRAMPKHFENDYSILPVEISRIFYAAL